MLNLIKMDIYRTRKMKSLWILWLIMVMIIFISTALLKTEFVADQQKIEAGAVPDNDGAMATPEPENIDLGIAVVLPESASSVPTVFDVVYANIQGKFIAIIIAIFTVVFVTADVNHGYIKNIAGQVKHRSMLVASKAVVLLLYTAITMIITVIVQFAANLILLSSSEFGPWKDLAIYVGLETILHFALTLIIMLVAMGIRNNVGTMAIAICLCMNMMVIIYGLVDKVVGSMGIKGFNTLNYTVTGKISLLPLYAQAGPGISALIVGVVFAAVMLAGSCFIFTKRDVR